MDKRPSGATRTRTRTRTRTASQFQKDSIRTLIDETIGSGKIERVEFTPREVPTQHGVSYERILRRQAFFLPSFFYLSSSRHNHTFTPVTRSFAAALVSLQVPFFNKKNVTNDDERVGLKCKQMYIAYAADSSTKIPTDVEERVK